MLASATVWGADPLVDPSSAFLDLQRGLQPWQTMAKLPLQPRPAVAAPPVQGGLQAWQSAMPSISIQPQKPRQTVKLPPRLPNSAPNISPPLQAPNDVYTWALASLLRTPAARRYETRFITYWPLPAEEFGNLEKALKFWTASLSNRRQTAKLEEVPGVGWKVYLSDYGWSHEAWEALISKDPYFNVSLVESGHVARRGWLDPNVESRVRILSTSTRAVVRGDRFLALTGTDVPDGFYSKFLQLPGSEAELFKLKGIDLEFLNKNALLRGGAVLGGASIVAIHNRELQLLPTPIGLDERFLWRSLDTLADVGKESVLENFLGTVRFAGKEYIGTNPNGTHYYYLANAQNKQVGEVPTKVAQDHQDPHDATVITPYKCVSCHGPKAGIRHFDDAIRRLALGKHVGLAVITKGYYADTQLREALEDYYMSPMGRDIAKQQESYTRVISDLTGLTPEDNARNFIKFVNQYLHGNVSKSDVCREIGVEPEQINAYLKQTGNPVLLALLAGEHVSRLAFESAFRDAMTARIHPWERSPSHAVPIANTPQSHPGRHAHPAVKQPGKY